jgi:glycosyltransferase involved in cell wall biosynthesis
MRVGFNARTLAAAHARGWTRYTVQLLRNLPSFDVELVLFTEQQLNPEHLAQLEPGSFRVVQSPPMPYLAWEQAWLPLAAARERVALLHAPANYGLPLFAVCPRLLTLHDAIDVAFEPTVLPQPFRQRLVKASFWAARHSASKVITVSEHAKTDLARHWSIPESKISVIHEASDLHERAAATIDEEQRLFDELGIPGKFVMYAGGFERRKNVDFLLKAFSAAALPGVSLVLVGSNPPRFSEDGGVNSTAGAVHTTGFVSDTVLTALYRRAEAFVYPSLYEGFGLQLCEAMSFGCPTLAADATSLPEVLGPGGDTFPLSSVDVLVSQLRRIALDPIYRQTLSDRATLRAKEFSWRKTAQATFDLYRETCR